MAEKSVWKGILERQASRLSQKAVATDIEKYAHTGSSQSLSYQQEQESSKSMWKGILERQRELQMSNATQPAATSLSEARQRQADYKRNSYRIGELLSLIEQMETEYPGLGRKTVQGGEILTPLTDENTRSTYEQYVAEKEKLEAANRLYGYGQKAVDEAYLRHSGNADYGEVSQARYRATTGWDTADAYRRIIDEKMRQDHSLQEIHSISVSDPLGTYLDLLEKEKEREKEYLLTQHPALAEFEKAIKTGRKSNWEQLTPEEKSLYYYMLNTGKDEEALAFLDGMTVELNRRANEAKYAKLQNTSGGEMVLHNVASVPANVVGGVSAFMDDTFRALTGEEQNPYSSAHAWRNYGQNVRTATAEDIYTATDGFSIAGISLADVYQAGMSGVDSLVGVALFNKGYSVVAGMGAASDKAKELYERGASQEQIMAGSLAAGAAEIAFEKFSIDHFLNARNATNWKMVVRNLLTQGGVEASEESLTEIANIVSDTIIMGSQSDWEKGLAQYKADGCTDGQAIAMMVGDMATQVWKAAASGFISGAGMGGGGSTVNYLQNRAAYTEMGQSYLQQTGVDMQTGLAQVMQATAPGTDTHTTALNMLQGAQSGREVSYATFGRLLAESQSKENVEARERYDRTLQSAEGTGVRMETAEAVARVAVSLKKEVQFATPQQFAVTGADGKVHYAAGKYDRHSDTVLLNPFAGEEALTGYLLAHELTHSAENTMEYRTLATYIRRMMGEEAWLAEVTAMAESRRQMGAPVDEEGAAKEMVADWIGKNLYTGGFAQAVASGKAQSGGAILRVLDKVRRAIGIKNSRSARNIAMLERLFMQMMESEGTAAESKGADGSYAIQSQSSVVDLSADNELAKRLEGVFGSRKYREIQAYILEVLHGQPIRLSDGKEVIVDKSDALHIANKAATKKTAQIYRIRELVENAQLYAEDAHPEHNKFDYFCYYIVNVRYQGETFPLYLNVGKGKADGQYHLYDITNKIRDTADRINGLERPKPNEGYALTNGVSSDSISNPDENVKGNSENGQNAFLVPDRQAEMDRRIETYDSRVAAAEALADQHANEPSAAFRSQLQTGEDTAPNASGATQTAAQGRTLEELARELGDRELDRRMYMAMQVDKLPATVTLDGIEMNTAAYLNAVEEQLPDTREELEAYIAQAEKRLAEETKAAYEAGEMKRVAGLPVNLQLFAARRKLEIDLAPEEGGSKTRRFFWQRTRGLDANKAHEAELLEYLAGRSETYSPICNEKTLDKAQEALDRPGYMDDLVKRLGRSNPRDLFNEVDMAAAMVLINRTKNDGDLELYADLVQGLSRKGTAAGRAVQILSLQAKLTPEGTIRAAQRTLQQETDRVHGDGTSNAIDKLADTVVDAVERAMDAHVRSMPTFEEDGEFQRQIEEWETLNDTAYITVGNIPGGAPLHQVGIPAGKLYFDVSKLKKAMADHDDHLSTGILKQIPELLKNPIAIVEYKPGEGTNTVNVYGNLYYHGTPVTVGIVVTSGRDGSIISKVRTVHARRDFAKQITDQSILYLGENKNETDSWFQAQGQRVPMRGTIYGFIRSIAHPMGNVNAVSPTLTREELVDGLVEDISKENDPYITTEQIRSILERAVNNAANLPAHLKKMLQSDKTIVNLADRIAKVSQNGHLNTDVLRRAFEEALELPHLTTEDVGRLTELVNAMGATEDGTAQRAEAEEAIYRFLGAKMAVTPLERLQAWRKFAMLANPKTHFRNIISNLAMYQAVGRMDTAFANLLQRMLLDSSEQTACLGWSHTEHGRAILPTLQKAAERAVVEMQRGGGKYDIAASRLGRYKKYFGENAIGERLNKANDLNSTLLEKEDEFFFRAAYIDALGQIMTARGTTEVVQDIHQLAYDRALDATFRADNAIHEVLMSLKRYAQSNKTGRKLFGNVVDVVIPFSKTPANIAKQTVLHSPLGVAKGAWDIYRATKNGDARAKAAAINTLAQGMTGSLLWAVGILLGTIGWFNTGYGKTEKERAADELAGIQENSLVVGGWSVTLDWLQPAAAPLIVGASMAQRIREDGLGVGAVFGAVMDGTDSLFELSMLQSLYDILGGYDAGASATAGSILENVVSQSIPTLVGQAARAIDPVQRKTKGNNDFETVVNQVLAKIPGLTYLLDPELDVWGGEVYRTGKADTGGAVLNAVGQFLLPANIKRATGDDNISREILRLYDEKHSKAIPTALSRDDATEHGLDYTDTNRQLGTVQRAAVEDLLNDRQAYTLQVELENGRRRNVTKRYSQMTDEERRRVLGRIYTKAKAEYTDEETDDAYFEELIRRLG